VRQPLRCDPTSSTHCHLLASAHTRPQAISQNASPSRRQDEPIAEGRASVRPEESLFVPGDVLVTFLGRPSVWASIAEAPRPRSSPAGVAALACACRCRRGPGNRALSLGMRARVCWPTHPVRVVAGITDRTAPPLPPPRPLQLSDGRSKRPQPRTLRRRWSQMPTCRPRGAISRAGPWAGGGGGGGPHWFRSFFARPVLLRPVPGV